MSAVLQPESSIPPDSISDLIGSEGNAVLKFAPVAVTGAQLAMREAQFLRRFEMTMTGNARSLLASDVYHETSTAQLEALFDKGQITHEEHQGLTIVLTGQAWHDVSKAKVAYDEQVIESALQDGLLDKINATKLHLVSYGPGPNGTADRKEGQVIRALKQQDRDISLFSTVDVNRSYAVNAAAYIGNQHTIPAHSVVGDFVWGKVGGLPIQPDDTDVTRLVTVFGNTPFNAASFSVDGKTRTYEDGVENFFSKMNRQHGMGHYLLLSVDTDQNVNSQLSRYARTNEHEQLILSPIALARLRGIITEPYPILAHWKMAVSYDRTENSVIMSALSKDDHSMKTINGHFNFKAGDERVIMASHKWQNKQHYRILTNSGYELIETYERQHCPHQLLLVRAARDPRREPY